MDDSAGIRLPTSDPEKLRDAVAAALADQRSDDAGGNVTHASLFGLPSAAALQAGAAASVDGSEENQAAAEFFQALLELGYLVASADGLAEEESDALALLVEQVTGAAVGKATLVHHFANLHQAVEMLGRRERLGRVAAQFEGNSERANALCFAALVAMADGVLAGPELETLQELGAHYDLTDDQVVQTARAVAAEVENHLGGAS